MKTILCYGDSLTFGANPDPDSSGRHAFEDRWPTALGAELDGTARIIAEGLGGRTTVFDDYSACGDRNGARVLPTLLSSHDPLDLVIIMLGTNDMKQYLCGSAPGAAVGMKRLVEIVRTHPYAHGEVPGVIMVAPPHCIATENADLDPIFRHGIKESQSLAAHYERMARELKCGFFDAAGVAKASPLDGVHLDAENTRAIGRGLVPLVRAELKL